MYVSYSRKCRKKYFNCAEVLEIHHYHPEITFQWNVKQRNMQGPVTVKQQDPAYYYVAIRWIAILI